MIHNGIKLFEENMLDRMIKFKVALGVFWGFIIFSYEMIINGKFIVGNYTFLFLSSLAIISWLIVQGYTEVNKLVFLYLKIALLNFKD